jgi:hypothetical protein
MFCRGIEKDVKKDLGLVYFFIGSNTVVCGVLSEFLNVIFTLVLLKLCLNLTKTTPLSLVQI